MQILTSAEDIVWHKHSRRFLEGTDDITTHVNRPPSEDTFLDLLLRNNKKPARDVKVSSSLAAMTVRAVVALLQCL